ncbi:MAG: hypothetical protein H6618_02965 [Deltaproteobacteria bacterium]|nr:hypothetical protein [Deltaproteobacteria bacterium]
MTRVPSHCLYVLAMTGLILTQPSPAADKTTPKLPAAKLTSQATKDIRNISDFLLSDCQTDWAAPSGGPGYFDPDSRYYYHLGNTGLTQKDQKNRNPIYRHLLFRVDLNNAQSSAIMSITLPSVRAIIPFAKDRLSAVIAFIFDQPDSGCTSGWSRYVGFPISSVSGQKKTQKKLSVIQGKGNIRLTETPGFPVVWDQQKHAFLEFDFNTIQSRLLSVRLSETEIPVYYDPGKRHYYAWHFKDQQQQRGLVAYDGSGKIAGRLQFHNEDKLLQHKNLFGAVRIQQDKNSLLIIEPERWSGSSTEKSYPVHVPQEHPVATAAVRPDFRSKLVLVSGFHKNQRQQWRKLYIFDYQKSWLLSTFTPPAGQYIAYEQISDNGQWVIAELRSTEQETSTALALFSVQSRTWTNIPLPPQS